MDTDGHGYQALAGGAHLTKKVSEACDQKSVFIGVHPWFMTSSGDSICGI
jgi:hypothetical protein